MALWRKSLCVPSINQYARLLHKKKKKKNSDEKENNNRINEKLEAVCP